MINADSYYIVEIAGDSIVAIAERETFCECLSLRRDAEAMRPESLIGIANRNYIHITVLGESFVVNRLFDGSVWLEAFGSGISHQRITIGRFASLATAIGAAQAFAPLATQQKEAA